MTAFEKYIYDHRIAQKMLMALNMCWLVYYSHIYVTVLVNRPYELYEPLSWFGKLFIPVFPTPIYYFTIVLSAAAAGLAIMFSARYRIIFQIILVFGLLFVNSVNWSYGFLSHVGHIMILANLLAVFLPGNNNENQQQLVLSFKWYYAAILSTYSLSAYWKILEISDDLTRNDYSNSWLNPAATKNTVISGYVWMHEPVPAFLTRLLEFHALWLVVFLVTTFLMLLAPLSVLNQRCFKLMLIFLVLFHMGNTLLLRAEFFATPVMLILFIIPYHTFNRQKLRHNQFISKAASRYT